MDPYERNSNYNSEFSADISDKMRVPSRLSVQGPVANNPGNQRWFSGPQEGTAIASSPMDVPDKILVAGSDQHVEMTRKSIIRSSGDVAEEVLDPSGLTNASLRGEDIRVEPLPTSMVLTQFPYPGIDSSQDEKKIRGGPASDSDFFEDDAMITLSRQIADLRNRMLTMERESHVRNQRDMLIYAALGTLLIMRVYSALFSRH